MDTKLATQILSTKLTCLKKVYFIFFCKMTWSLQKFQNIKRSFLFLQKLGMHLYPLAPQGSTGPAYCFHQRMFMNLGVLYNFDWTKCYNLLAKAVCFKNSDEFSFYTEILIFIGILIHWNPYSCQNSYSYRNSCFATGILEKKFDLKNRCLLEFRSEKQTTQPQGYVK